MANILMCMSLKGCTVDLAGGQPIVCSHLLGGQGVGEHELPGWASRH